MAIPKERMELSCAVSVLMLLLSSLTSCTKLPGVDVPHGRSRPELEIMALTEPEGVHFDEDSLRDFMKPRGVEVRFVPAEESASERLTLYRQLFRMHSTKPDLLQIDVVWPDVLADDLVDLRLVAAREVKKFAPELIKTFTVGGRLTALPASMDAGVLYYRPELLQKYGFQNPPATWDELEKMAKRIQEGERNGGNKDFWGYSFQGAAYEGLTCNALEWQTSSGAGNFIENSGFINVRDRRFLGALHRARKWIGTISPPGEYIYQEWDSLNLWNEGQVAFLRNWTSMYNLMTARPGKDIGHFAVAMLPGGHGGRRCVLGGKGLAISKHSANRELASKALLFLTSEDHDRQSIKTSVSDPTHITVAKTASQRISPEVMGCVMRGLVARPSLLAGANYDKASQAYSGAVNGVLRGDVEPEVAMARLEKTLVAITGFPAMRY